MENRMKTVRKIGGIMVKETKNLKRIVLLTSDDFWIQKFQKSIIDGIEEACGLNAVVDTFQATSCQPQEFLEKMKEAHALVIGTDSVHGNICPEIWKMVTSIPLKIWKEKRCGLFYIKGAKSKGDEALRQYLNFMGADTSLPSFAVTEIPEESTCELAKNYGYDLGCIFLGVANPRRPKYVKCLVCGEIFDASLGICPVCGVGLDQCVPVEEEELLYRRDTDKKYVILGGGIAAVSAAQEIRKRDKTGEIHLFSKEKDLPVNRPILTKNFQAASEKDPTIFIHPREWYLEQGIQLHLGVSGETICKEKKQIILDTKETYTYDELILATGAECFVPPFEGHDRPEVVTIRHLEDCQKITAYLKEAKSVAIIGGGVLGLEAANEFLRMGLAVTVLEAAPQIVGRQVDAKSAEILKRKIQSLKVKVYEGVSIRGLKLAEDDRLLGVQLQDGTLIEADFVVVSCGNRGNVKIAESAEVEIERSIVVNSKMQTNVEHIYACGDCCQWNGMNYQLWQEAAEQGKVAGANAAGEILLYTSPILGLHLEGFGTVLYALGDPGKQEHVNYKKVCIDDEVGKKYKQYWFSQGVLKGVVAIGAEEEVTEMTEQLAKQEGYKHIFPTSKKMSLEESILEREKRQVAGGMEDVG